MSRQTTLGRFGISHRNTAIEMKVKWLVSKETLCCVGGQVKQLVDYQLEVDKGKLTAVANLKRLANSLRRLIYLYQLQVDNQLEMKVPDFVKLRRGYARRPFFHRLTWV